MNAGRQSTVDEIDSAIAAARLAFGPWSLLSLEKRVERLQAFAAKVQLRRAEFAEAIARETGKPRWESLGEVDSVIAKIAISIDAFAQRRCTRQIDTSDACATVRYKPHGVLAVFGPFNFPAHLPNGHIVPALLAGNTIVFKPSEYAPLVGQMMVQLWQEADLPAGVLNLVQGGRDAGKSLAEHPGIDGLLFTGSVAAGMALHRVFAGQPQKLLALEMGGNNPLIVWNAADLHAAAYMTIQSAFLTAGQRCSCARRLIVQAGPAGDCFVEQLAQSMQHIRVGAYTDEPEPFMGPVISAQAAQRLLDVQKDLRDRGGLEIVSMKRLDRCPAMLTPGLMDVTEVRGRDDAEHFGPFLQLIRVADFDAALREANNTSFGLCAGLLSDSRELYERFYQSIHAGIVNWNRPTTGASSRLPFGGVGLSGNHRPSGYFACDYCSDPVASLETDKLTLPAKLTPGISI